MSLAGSWWGPVLEEAYALALEGRFDEAVALAEGWSRQSIEAGSASRHLLKARVLRARGKPEDLMSARRLLEESPEWERADGWRRALTLARLDLADNRRAEAASRLKKALEEFRAHGETHGEAAPLLARMLLSETEVLEKPRGDGPSEALPDPGSLLRLIELGKKLAEEMDPDEVLRIVLHEAIELSGLARGFVVLVIGPETGEAGETAQTGDSGRTGETLEFALAENLDWSEVAQPTFEVSKTLIKSAIEDAKPIFMRMEDTENHRDAAHSLAEIGAHSVACVPLVHSAGAPLGVLYLDGRDPAHVFTSAKERLIELFASQAAAALENARAHRLKSQALAEAEATIRRQRGEETRRDRYFELTGSSDAMQDLYRNLDRIVPTEEPVLILGETGTGKELVARLIHEGGPRRARTFVAANCASMAETLLETELFGHERGAFTGAHRPRAGLFEHADGGTLFLDEVGDMSPRMQADLLRALQSGEVRRVGGNAAIRVDVRVIAATHRDLDAMIRRGVFRLDLYFRLNVLSVRMPALRDRAFDVPLLIRELLARLTPEGENAPRISERAMRRLASYPWPGNVRELENVVRRLRVQCAETIEVDHLPQEILEPRTRQGGARATGAASSLRSLEAEAIRRAVGGIL